MTDAGAVAVVDALVDHATTTFDVDRDRVVLAGFSQGATIAAEYALATPRRYGGVALLSGVAVDPDAASADAVDGGFAGGPVLLAVGDDDPHLSTERIHTTADAFEALGGDVDVEIAAGVGHEVTDDVLERVGKLLENARADR